VRFFFLSVEPSRTDLEEPVMDVIKLEGGRED
jgi:hypothetical protein